MFKYCNTSQGLWPTKGSQIRSRWAEGVGIWGGDTSIAVSRKGLPHYRAMFCQLALALPCPWYLHLESACQG